MKKHMIKDGFAESSIERIVTGVFGTMALVACVWHSGRHGLWLDEAPALIGTMQPFGELFVHAPPGGALFQLIGALWTKIVGTSMFLQELPSALAVFGSMVYGSALLRRIQPNGFFRILGAAAIFCLITPVIKGIDIRPYGVLSFAVTGFLFHSYKNNFSGISTFIFACIMAIAHPIGGYFYLPLSIVSVLLLDRRFGDRMSIPMKNIGLLIFVAMAIQLTNTLSTLNMLSTGGYQIRGDLFRDRNLFSWAKLAGLYAEYLRYGLGVFDYGVVFMNLLIPVMVLWSQNRALKGMWFIFPVTGYVVVLYLGYPFFTQRYLLPSLIPFLVFFFGGLQPRNSHIVTLFITLMILTGNISGHQWYWNYKYRPFLQLSSYAKNAHWLEDSHVMLDPEGHTGVNSMYLFVAEQIIQSSNCSECLKNVKSIVLNPAYDSLQGVSPVLPNLHNDIEYNSLEQQFPDWLFIPVLRYHRYEIGEILPWQNADIMKEMTSWYDETAKGEVEYDGVIVHYVPGGIWVDIRCSMYLGLENIAQWSRPVKDVMIYKNLALEGYE